jgi:hypothetical protein
MSWPSVYVRQQEEQYTPSLLRRAWDTIENILGFIRPSTDTQASTSLLPTPITHPQPTLEPDVQSTTSSSISAYAMAYHHVHTALYADDDATSDNEGRPLSRTSQEIIRAPRTRSLKRYNTWKQENEGLEWVNGEERRAKELIANWAMGEVAPWFN